MDFFVLTLLLLYFCEGLTISNLFCLSIIYFSYLFLSSLRENQIEFNKYVPRSFSPNNFGDYDSY